MVRISLILFCLPLQSRRVPPQLGLGSQLKLKKTMQFLLAGFSHAQSLQMLTSDAEWEMSFFVIHLPTTRIISHYFSLVGG